ncbi:hypothetical protein BDA99DRAFT_521733 [Phascolomyces articulosus]|uniref:Uncharacterized protein n=1 Tax=Phascolomyces articulosus TaxID=60185 RepID=A0AAD5P9N2_9FUNG|nr:hypothetical protein BDA99DRAFT_521733 [Phascolomyces articulosus]
MVSCAKRIQETSDVTVKVHNEQTVVQERMQTLLENDARLKTTFAEIDEIERIVNHVKETYNKVAESVDDMEKAINASISSGFPFLQKRNETVQPYFPPPLPVNIYHTKDLFSTSTTPQPQPPLSSSPSSSSLSIKE